AAGKAAAEAPAGEAPDAGAAGGRRAPALDGVNRLLYQRGVDPLNRDHADRLVRVLGGVVEGFAQLLDVLVHPLATVQDQLVAAVVHADRERDSPRVAAGVHGLAVAAPTKEAADPDEPGALAASVHELAVDVTDGAGY